MNRNQKIVLVVFALFAGGVITRPKPVFDSRDLGGCVIFMSLFYVARDKKKNT